MNKGLPHLKKEKHMKKKHSKISSFDKTEGTKTYDETKMEHENLFTEEDLKNDTISMISIKVSKKSLSKNSARVDFNHSKRNINYRPRFNKLLSVLSHKEKKIDFDLIKNRSVPININSVAKGKVNYMLLNSFKNQPLKSPANVEDNKDIYERNIAWLKEIEKRMENKGVMEENKLKTNCTFEPSLIKPQPKYIKLPQKTFEERNNEWMQNLTASNATKKVQMDSKERNLCTFSPKILKPARIINTKDDDFYCRNVIWKEEVKNKIEKRFSTQNNVLKYITVG